MKKDKVPVRVIVFFLCAFLVFLTILYVTAKPKCYNCHKRTPEKGSHYCSVCLKEASKLLAEKKEKEAKVNKTSDTPDPVKTTSSSNTTSSYTKTTTSSSNKTTGSSSKTTSSSKKTYNDLEFDPVDYDDPDDYAEDAWGVDFDDYDDAYDYWEDY